ncbi:hypothetical protein LTR17_007855 [Elasticomyces elasticus]|nr:hypothetical protein LTR17_007855 [Elasticomyces elasticus]
MTRPQYNGGLAPATQEDQIRNDYLNAIKFKAARDVKVDVRDLLDLLKHQQQVVQSLASLEKNRRSSRTRETPEMKSLAACKASMSVMHRFLCQSMGFNPLITQPSERSSIVAEKVFRVPELAEMVLLELTPAAILQAMNTCKDFASSITSPGIQAKLSLRRQIKGHWYSPFEIRDNLISISWRSLRTPQLHNIFQTRIATTAEEADRIVQTRVATVYATFQDQMGSDDMTRSPLARIGKRGLSMFICQPPITEMDVYLSCCMPGSRGRSYTAGNRKSAGTIRNAKGLSVGDLHRATAEYQKQHELCPHADKYSHDGEGRVLMEVSYEGLLQLRADDPFVLQGYKIRAGFNGGGYSPTASPIRSAPYYEMEDMIDYSDDGMEPEGGIEEYIAYKKKAHVKGEQIVSMADYFSGHMNA